jgi:hypothetical protein
VESPDISPASKAELNRKLNEAAEILLKLNREKGYTENTPCQGGNQTPAA